MNNDKGEDEMMNDVKEFIEKQKQIESLKLVILEDRNERIHVSEFGDQSITPEVYANIRMNSYARNEIFPKLTNQTLIQSAEYYQSQCKRPSTPCSTYEEVLAHKIVPELIARLKAEQNKPAVGKQVKVLTGDYAEQTGMISVIRLDSSYPITVQFENGDTNDYHEEQIEIIDR